MHRENDARRLSAHRAALLEELEDDSLSTSMRTRILETLLAITNEDPNDAVAEALRGELATSHAELSPPDDAILRSWAVYGLGKLAAEPPSFFVDLLVSHEPATDQNFLVALVAFDAACDRAEALRSMPDVAYRLFRILPRFRSDDTPIEIRRRARWIGGELNSFELATRGLQSEDPKLLWFALRCSRALFARPAADEQTAPQESDLREHVDALRKLTRSRDAHVSGNATGLLGDFAPRSLLVELSSRPTLRGATRHLELANALALASDIPGAAETIGAGSDVPAHRDVSTWITADELAEARERATVRLLDFAEGASTRHREIVYSRLLFAAPSRLASQLVQSTRARALAPKPTDGDVLRARYLERLVALSSDVLPAATVDAVELALASYLRGASTEIREIVATGILNRRPKLVIDASRGIFRNRDAFATEASEPATTLVDLYVDSLRRISGEAEFEFGDHREDFRNLLVRREKQVQRRVAGFLDGRAPDLLLRVLIDSLSTAIESLRVDEVVLIGEILSNRAVSWEPRIVGDAIQFLARANGERAEAGLHAARFLAELDHPDARPALAASASGRHWLSVLEGAKDETEDDS